MPFHVYVVTHLESGRQYVGQAKSPTQRWGLHLVHARSGFNSPLHRAIRTYGHEAFGLEVVESHGTLEEALRAETRLIVERRTLVSDGGFNASHVGTPRTKMSARESEIWSLQFQQRQDDRTRQIRTNEAMKVALGAGSARGLPRWAVKQAKRSCGLAQ